MTIAADDGRPLSLTAAVDRGLDSTPRLPCDVAMAELCRTYATLLDDALDRMSDAAEEDEARDFARMVTVVAKIGPRLENTLGLLGMAPGARPARPPEGGTGDPATSALAAVRADAGRTATAGLDYAAAVDPAVTEADARD